MPAHKHAELMMEYAKDAATHERPWELWQYRMPTAATPEYREWRDSPDGYHMNWNDSHEYRRRPKPLECWVITDNCGEAREVSNHKDAAELYVSKWGGNIVHMRAVV